MESLILISEYKSPFGELLIGSYKEALCLCDWKYRKMRPSIDKHIKMGLGSEFHLGDSKINDQTIKQLDEYFNGTRREFTIPIRMVGSDFQKSIWKLLLEIPYGKTDSYLDLSKKFGNLKAIRAVASANGANSISILIPCHRIIGSNGDLVGYAGGLAAKKRLLKLEGLEQFNQVELSF
jgi:methylated-DNA-[protein]-cysteine S-methyltransferase